MAHSPTSHLAIPTQSARPSRWLEFARIVSEYLQIFGAAVRASRALEARREPRPADLKLLGITGKLPKAW